MTSSRQQVIECYDSCEIDYKVFWNLNKNFSMHYGYWDETTKNLSEALQRENDVLARVVKLKKSDKVLDAGCGVGGSAIYLAKKFSCKVTGITIVPRQVKSARRNAKKEGAEKLTSFHEMDFCNTVFKDNFFDVVWAIEGFWHAENKKKFLEEAFRLLKKGGRLVIGDFFSSKEKFDKDEEALMKDWFHGWATDSLITANKLKECAKEVGFKRISFLDITKNVIPSAKRLYIYSFLGVFFGKFTEFLKIRNKTQTGNVMATHYQYKALKKKLWKYGIFYAEKK